MHNNDFIPKIVDFKVCYIRYPPVLAFSQQPTNQGRVPQGLIRTFLFMSFSMDIYGKC